jgi:hypothetical protein
VSRQVGMSELEIGYALAMTYAIAYFIDDAVYLLQ